MTKPISPAQTRKPALGSPRHLAELRKKVTRQLNRKLKEGSRTITIPNHLDASEIALIVEDYQAQGWTVTVVDHRDTMIGNMAWVFDFSVQ